VRLILASRSPRRAELLTRIGLAFEVRAVDMDESVLPGEEPAAYVVRLAAAKAAAAFAEAGAADALALGADTAVVLDGRVLGKPADRAEALGMLQALSGRSHLVMTGVAVHGARGTSSRCAGCSAHAPKAGRPPIRCFRRRRPLPRSSIRCRRATMSDDCTKNG